MTWWVKHTQGKKHMNNWGIILGVVLLSSVAFAAEIQAPEKVVSYAPFTFRVVLPPTDTFSQAAVHFDNILVATIYPTGTCAVQPDWIPFIIHCATFDADTKTNAGLTTIITHTGFFPGPHTIFVSTQGSAAETSLFTINVFDAVDEASQTALSMQVGDVNARVSELEVESVSAQENIYTNNANLTKAIEQAKTELQTVQTQLAPLITPKEDTQQGFQIPFISDFFRPTSPTTGMVAGSNAPLLGLGIIAAIALGFFVLNGRKKEGFGDMNKGTPFFEGTLDTLFKGVPSGKTNNERPEAQPKKWSSDVEEDLREDIEENPPERDTKIHYSDLTR
ncbi:MAG: hypothetical protein FJY86_01985 [Candidatus Diapherotrites archaeon]|uniref:Uncharacterized protein n=1 Tax=Candidatus Iainarchaeum sp. TaxID=3101447 RepID=A0A8T4C6Q6_9ARCH|nr:hypothetical protein [Candidatus Diapherotrites archaeon]